MNTITFKCKKDLGTLNHDVVIKGLFANQSIDSFFDNSNKEKIKNILKLENFKASFNKSVDLYGSNNISRVSIVGLGKKNEFNSDKLRSIASNLTRKFDPKSIKTLTVDAKSFMLDDPSMAQAFSEGLVLGKYHFVEYKSKNNIKSNIKNVLCVGKCHFENIEKGYVLGSAVNYSRDLGNHPPNIMTPTKLSEMSIEISKSKNMKSTIIDVKEFEKLGFGSFYGVARGSVMPAKMIIVEYNGGKKNDKPIALVGKGLTFDSGGISLKPGARMDEMKFDMCGSATVLGVMKAVSVLQPNVNIVFAIGATENMPGGNAQRPGDIVKAYNGKTIEILNTDAEGRLVLADVLSYIVDKFNPSEIIDFATLTGAVLVALGDRASGIMGNNSKLLDKVKSSSENTGERVWELPMWDEYSKDIESKVADIKNLGRSGLAGTISAGAFLKEFVDNVPWVHMDIAGTAWGPKEPAYMPKNGATGVAVRLIYDLIENI